MEESATILMAQKSRDLKARGIEVIDLSLGEPDFPAPPNVCQAAKEAIDAGYHHYTPVAGYPELRKAISDKFKRDNGLDYSADQIVVSTGAKQSLANIMLSLLNPGDEVIVPTPYWVSYAAQVQLAGARLVAIDTGLEQDFRISQDDLEAAITPKTRMFLFSSPCNPTGSVYSSEELESLVKVFLKHPDILIVSDEIYEYINFFSKHVSIGAFPGMIDRTITVNGLSKGFAMTGWRMGYMGAPLWVAKACTKMQGQFTSGANSITQRAAITAINGPLDATFAMREAFLDRRNKLIEWLSGIDGLELNHPGGAFYVFPRVKALFGKHYKGTLIDNADTLCLLMLEHAHVSPVTGAAFGAPDYIRISYATGLANLQEAARRIKAFIAELT